MTAASWRMEYLIDWWKLHNWTVNFQMSKLFFLFIYQIYVIGLWKSIIIPFIVDLIHVIRTNLSISGIFFSILL